MADIKKINLNGTTYNLPDGGGQGTSNYANLTNKPSINNIELSGNKTLNDLGIQASGNYVEDNNYVHTDNNYTTNEKNKLSNIEANANVNIIETVKVNGTALSVANKAVDVSVPTQVSDLTNDSGFTSNTGTITGITMNGVSKGTSGVVDLGSVITQHQDISGKQDVLTAGNNITIQNNVISASGGSSYIGDYSISEIDTGATWIGGKKIYKKSINIGSLPNATNNVPYAHNISNFSELVDFQARWYDTNDKAWFTQSREGMVNNNNFFNIAFRVNATNVLVTGSVMNWSSRTSDCIVTIYYTKTTD